MGNSGIPQSESKVINWKQGLRTKQSVANVNDATPTDAELDSAFGTPASLGRGYMATVDDADADLRMFLCITSDAGWYYVLLAKAA